MFRIIGKNVYFNLSKFFYIVANVRNFLKFKMKIVYNGCGFYYK